jgi:hypothetical protein
MDLLSVAKRYAEHPSDVEALTSFIQALADERQPERIREILRLDFERVAGLSLNRLMDLLPDDVDLLLTAALWKYHFGLDDEARDHLECAKRIAPLDQRVFRVEVFLNYGQDIDYIRALCVAALHSYPTDEWVRGVLRTIDDTGQLTVLEAPPLGLKWHAALTGR